MNFNKLTEDIRKLLYQRYNGVDDEESIISDFEFFKINNDDKKLIIELADRHCADLRKLCPTHTLDQKFCYESFNIEDVEQIYYDEARFENNADLRRQNCVSIIEKILRLLVSMNKNINMMKL